MNKKSLLLSAACLIGAGFLMMYAFKKPASLPVAENTKMPVVPEGGHPLGGNVITEEIAINDISLSDLPPHAPALEVLQ